MKKIAIFLTAFLVIAYSNVKAEVILGISAASHSVDVSGTETLRSSGKKTNGGADETAGVPEIFIEAEADSGFAMGLAYIPTREMGSKSRTDTGDESAGTYKAEAELDNVIQAYVDVPFTDLYGGTLYGKLGIQHATVTTLESLNSGSAYPDQDLFGYTVGLGVKGDLPYGDGLIYKLDATYTDFEDYSAGAADGNGNKITADLEDVAVKISIGKKF